MPAQLGLGRSRGPQPRFSVPVTLLHMAAAPPMLEHPHTVNSRIDLLGALASSLCALHCIALPLLLAIVPLAGFESLQSHEFDLGFVSFALLLGAFAIWRGYRRHGQASVVAGLLGSAALLLPALLLFHQFWWHALVLGAGGLLLAWTHVLTLRFLRAAGCADPSHNHLVTR